MLNFCISFSYENQKPSCQGQLFILQIHHQYDYTPPMTGVKKSPHEIFVRASVNLDYLHEHVYDPSETNNDRGFQDGYDYNFCDYPSFTLLLFLLEVVRLVGQTADH